VSEKDPLKVDFKWGYIPEKCPQCGGNLFMDKDEGKRVKKCLQCSRTFPIAGDKTETALPWVNGRRLK